MSENPAPAPTPPGWYPDGTGTGQLRWWSGAEWTADISTPYTGLVPARPTLPADRPVYSVFIWLIVLMPLVACALLFAWQPDFTFSSRSALANPYSFITPGYFLIIFGSWIIYGLSALFAWRDVVWLRAQGVVRPFPWPWIFLSTLVYVIGRSVIVHRVAAPRGRAPIWVLIGVVVVGFAVAIAWSVLLFSGIMSKLPDLSGYSNS